LQFLLRLFYFFVLNFSKKKIMYCFLISNQKKLLQFLHQLFFVLNFFEEKN